MSKPDLVLKVPFFPTRLVTMTTLAVSSDAALPLSSWPTTGKKYRKL